MGKDYITSLLMAYYDETKHIKIVTIELIGVKGRLQAFWIIDMF